ncbi:MAG: hypothetical protein HYY41_04980 [Chloroflexi bacterium]|nr:hypothetical protein [Chloroflexota bacterium]
MSGLISDSWWLPDIASIGDLVIGVGHHKEIADDEEVPALESWYRSLTPKGNLSNKVKCVGYSINSLNEWRKACNNTNVYRTLKVFNRNTGEASFLGPFLIDIDNGAEDLSDTQSITRQVVDYLTTQLNLSLDDLHIFFSGHKGFNIEIRPETMGISGLIADQIRFSSKRLDKIIAVLRNRNSIQDPTRNVVSSQGTVIDPIYGDRYGYQLKHPYIRLHNSINKWIRDDNKVAARRRIEIKYEQLWKKSTAEIYLESEKLAEQP